MAFLLKPVGAWGDNTVYALFLKKKINKKKNFLLGMGEMVPAYCVNANSL